MPHLRYHPFAALRMMTFTENLLVGLYVYHMSGISNRVERGKTP